MLHHLLVVSTRFLTLTSNLIHSVEMLTLVHMIKHNLSFTFKAATFLKIKIGFSTFRAGIVGRLNFVEPAVSFKSSSAMQKHIAMKAFFCVLFITNFFFILI
ncbi:zinc finger protein 532-like X2 [Biomphalaria pfeifferi]|uniref:Zinc finger protein 532-like X2 n=1 Tax=Biomphalaria pfeifferi TaxID=112525 RepID=A0AAD8BP85_BIOPF|nr:zinc finger protein 532-like X2 [Biomphalaria pfeifferi]